MRIVSEKLGNNISELPEHESSFSEGDMGELRVYLSEEINTEGIEADLLSKGVQLIGPVLQDAKIMIIRFKNTAGTLSGISETIKDVGIVGWQLFKESKVPGWAYATVGILAGVIALGWLGKK